ncbi:MAG: nucleotide exchange factor GrpE [Pseudobutyrivibrio sp.]|nr:nucleotide exchange factor GrpE [Pseudobutyrivibrio sp.]
MEEFETEAKAPEEEAVTEEAVNAEEAVETAESEESTGEAEEAASDEETSKDSKKKDKKKDKKDKKDEQIEQLKDQLMRNMAEFQNFRNRTDKEKSMMFDMGAKTIVEKVLPVVDNFERGLAGVNEGDDAFSDGMLMIYRQLMTMLKEAGVEPIEAAGKEFNPDFHNAVMQVPATEELESGMVAQELQKGYTYKDQVVRHSMVSVVE